MGSNKLDKMIKLMFTFIFIFIFSCQSNQDKKNDLKEKDFQTKRFKRSDELMYKSYNKIYVVNTEEYLKILPSLAISPENADQLLFEYCLKESKRLNQKYHNGTDRNDYISEQALNYKNHYFLAGIEQNQYIFLERIIKKSKINEWYVVYYGVSINSKNGEIRELKPLEIPYH